MSLFSWCTRRVGGLSMLALLGLCFWVLSNEFSKSPAHSPSNGQHITEGSQLWLKLFAYYSLLIHVLVFVFPMRACWAVFDLTESLRELAAKKQLREIRFELPRRTSSSSISSDETLTPSLQSSLVSDAEDTDISSYSDEDGDQDHIIHAIIIPNYKEELDGLRETLDVLSSHPQARHQYDIFLAMEMREHNAETKAMTLINEYVKRFRCIDFTLHPGDIPGEAAGKGSNTAWAAKIASERYPVHQRKDVIFTGIDADSHLSAQYFSHITSMHISHPETATTTMYCPPIIFDRNAHLVPMVVRVADILWCAAGLSGLYRGSSIRPPTSVYSMPLELVDLVGGWDTDCEAIGEDLHMYLKCFFALNGNLVTRTVLAPVSQSNVTGSGSGFRGKVDGCKARYKQAMRHMWGALDSGYAIREFATMLKQRKSLGRTFRPLHAISNDKASNYIPEAEICDSGVFSDITHTTVSPPSYILIFYLFHRLFEAHFLPVQMAILVISSSLYEHLTSTSTSPATRSLSWLFTLTNFLRIGGFLLIAVYMYFYESYHSLCLNLRTKEMQKAGLYEGMKEGFSKRSWRRDWADYVIMPIVAPAFGSVPSIQAQVSHFWTRELGYVVSGKPSVGRRGKLKIDGESGEDGRDVVVSV